MKDCEPESEGFSVDSFSSACTVKDCEHETDGSAESFLGECVVFCDNSGLLLGADE